MAKVSYANMKLKVDNSVSKFNFKEHEIEVLNYLPIEDKYDLIMITLQKAEENGVYNELKVDMYFHLNLVYMYSNLSFTEKQRENEGKLYDSLVSSGFMDNFLDTLKKEEYDTLYEYLTSNIQMNLDYRNTAGAVLQSFINDLPNRAKAAKEIVDSFEPEKWTKVVDFAKHANADRPIE